MKQSDFFALLLASVIVAGAVSYFLSPSSQTKAAELTEQVSEKPLTAATMSVEQESCEATVPAKAAILRRKDDSHYWGLADVDGYPVNFMVDTGASVVVLTFEDAQRMRLEPDTLEYKWRISTAGGETKGASVLLNSIRFGAVEVENVEAMILREGLEQSLLGISFLEQLYSYEFRGKQLIIRQ